MYDQWFPPSPSYAVLTCLSRPSLWYRKPFRSQSIQRNECVFCRVEQRTLSPMMLLDWDYLKGLEQLDRGLIVAGNLRLNHTERPLIRALNGDWPRLIREMFACKHGEFAQWSEEDWICTGCWFDFFRDTIWRWRLAQKERGTHVQAPRLARQFTLGF